MIKCRKKRQTEYNKRVIIIDNDKSRNIYQSNNNTIIIIGSTDTMINKFTIIANNNELLS